jgi:hypothetical protein
MFTALKAENGLPDAEAAGDTVVWKYLIGGVAKKGVNC